MLGGNYIVGNFGVVASTVLSNTSKPYINQTGFQRAKASQPDIVVIMLGSNDAHTVNFLSIDSFVGDYEKLVRECQALASKPEIFLVKPPPIFNNEFNLSNTNLVEGVIPRIEQVAEELGLPTIDAYTPFANHPGYFLDGVNPTQEGARIIASEVYNGIVHASENS
jgi:lysophospholipase L1-like esterase